MSDMFNRCENLIGHDNFVKISNAKILIFGVGGVGGTCAEALVRSGIKGITVVDNDKVDITNLNRQIIATRNSIGQDKVQVAKERFLAINPNLEYKGIKCFYLPETCEQVEFNGYDYVIDAIDTVSGKIEIIQQAKKANVRVISSMGTGGKLHPELLKVCDISKTKICPLARVMRRELTKRNIFDVKVVYSEEQGVSFTGENIQNIDNAKVSASMMFVPSVAGLLMAKTVIEDLIKG